MPHFVSLFIHWQTLGFAGSVLSVEFTWQGLMFWTELDCHPNDLGLKLL